MNKKILIALADLIRDHNAIAQRGISAPKREFSTDQIEALANFCAKQNPAFMRERWLGYIAGTNGSNGGAL